MSFVAKGNWINSVSFDALETLQGSALGVNGGGAFENLVNVVMQQVQTYTPALLSHTPIYLVDYANVFRRLKEAKENGNTILLRDAIQVIRMTKIQRKKHAEKISNGIVVIVATPWMKRTQHDDWNMVMRFLKPLSQPSSPWYLLRVVMPECDFDGVKIPYTEPCLLREPKKEGGATESMCSLRFPVPASVQRAPNTIGHFKGIPEHSACEYDDYILSGLIDGILQSDRHDNPICVASLDYEVYKSSVNWDDAEGFDKKFRMLTNSQITVAKFMP